ncbi:MAG: MBL fold metallo-hydrolase [Actinomycetia bacterium]|nr:MBL fold metallo-hydrolase [Actinomycetes bacterium]
MRDIVLKGDGFTVSRVVVGPLDNNVYLIEDTESGDALLIDAADDPEAIMRFVGDTNVVGVFTTHGHSDHHEAVPEVPQALDAPFILHPLDATIAGKPIDAAITTGPLPIGDTVATVAHTPGHTPGSVCLSLPGVVFTGDTLFPGGPGATRFGHSSFTTIIESLETELFSLPDETIVFPGHGASTTIGTERPQLTSWIERGW